MALTLNEKLSNSIDVGIVYDMKIPTSRDSDAFRFTSSLLPSTAKEEQDSETLYEV